MRKERGKCTGEGNGGMLKYLGRRDKKNESRERVKMSRPRNDSRL